MNDMNSLSHTKWECKYHIVFAPKYRRKVFYGEKRVEIGKILRMLCDWKKIEIVEAEACKDHVHMLVKIPPKVSVSSFVGYLKGRSSWTRTAGFVCRFSRHWRRMNPRKNRKPFALDNRKPSNAVRYLGLTTCSVFEKETESWRLTKAKPRPFESCLSCMPRINTA